MSGQLVKRKELGLSSEQTRACVPCSEPLALPRLKVAQKGGRLMGSGTTCYWPEEISTVPRLTQIGPLSVWVLMEPWERQEDREVQAVTRG